MKSLPVHTSSIPEARELADLASIAHDLKFVRDVLETMAQSKDETVTRACFSASHIAYRRCFKAAVRRHLSRDDVVALERNAIELHDHIMDQANKLVAHSVNPFEKTQTGIILDGDQVIGTMPFSGRLSGLSEPDIRQWQSLVSLVLSEVLSPKLKAAHTAMLAAAKELPVADIKRAPLLSYTAAGPEQAGLKRS